MQTLKRFTQDMRLFLIVLPLAFMAQLTSVAARAYAPLDSGHVLRADEPANPSLPASEQAKSPPVHDASKQQPGESDRAYAERMAGITPAPEPTAEPERTAAETYLQQERELMGKSEQGPLCARDGLRPSQHTRHGDSLWCPDTRGQFTPKSPQQPAPAQMRGVR